MPSLQQRYSVANMSDSVEEIKKHNSDLHGYSGALLVVVDNALWGANIVTFGLATLLVSLLAFVFTGFGVFLVQKFLSEDRTGVALAKGFVTGVMAGVPTGVVGTVGGIYILSKAGIRAIRSRN